MGKPAGPRIPSLLQSWHWTRRPIAFLERCQARYGRLFTLCPLGEEILLVADPDVVRAVYSCSDEVAHAERDPRFARLVGSSSLLLLNGAAHARRRRRSLSTMSRWMQSPHERGASIRDHTLEVLGRHPVGATFRLHDAARQIVLQSILDHVWGLPPGAGADRIRALVMEAMRLAERPANLVPLFLQDLLGKWSLWRRIVAIGREADAIIHGELARRRREATPAGQDYLSFLMAQGEDADGALDDVELRDELVTMLVAGHDTTATAIAWSVHELLRRPELLRRVRRELEQAHNGAGIDPERMAALPLLDAVVRETLRLHPAFVIHPRRLKRDVAVGGGTLPAESYLGLCPYLVHRQPDVFPEPERFAPERMLGRHPSASEWFPFGGGARRCIGADWAMYQMKMVLGTLLARGDLALADDTPERPVLRFFTLVPDRGVPVRRMSSPQTSSE